MQTAGKEFVEEKTVGCECCHGVDRVTKGTCWMIDRSIECVTTWKKEALDLLE